MAKRVSALAGVIHPGHFGVAGETGVTLSVVADLILWQIAAWPETATKLAGRFSEQIGASAPPDPCRAVTGADRTVVLARIEPLKWWLIGARADALDAELGAVLDLSHSRTRIRIDGPAARVLLNRHLPLDLREPACPVGAVASTAFHHVGVTLWRSETGYELFLPRGFARSLWEMLLQSAVQFGVEVRPASG